MAPGFWGTGDPAGAAVTGTATMLEKEGTEGKVMSLLECGV